MKSFQTIHWNRYSLKNDSRSRARTTELPPEKHPKQTSNILHSSRLKRVPKHCSQGSLQHPTVTQAMHHDWQRHTSDWIHSYIPTSTYRHDECRTSACKSPSRRHETTPPASISSKHPLPVIAKRRLTVPLIHPCSCPTSAASCRLVVFVTFPHGHNGSCRPSQCSSTFHPRWQRTTFFNSQFNSKCFTLFSHSSE